MKTLIFTSVLFTLLFVREFVPVFSQWLPDQRLTNNTGISVTAESNVPGIAGSGDTLHVVWTDDRDNNFEIYYKRSENFGFSWSNDTRLTNAPGYSWDQTLFLLNGVIHVVWWDARSGDPEIYYMRSSNAGLSWGSETRLTNLTGTSQLPSVAAAGNFVHIVWEERKDGNPELYYVRSTDGGANWLNAIRLTNDAYNSYRPCISVNNTFIHVVWFDDRGGNFDIFYKRSSNSGADWGPDTRLTYSSLNSLRPAMSVLGSSIHIAWSEGNNSNRQIVYKRSTDSGVTWGPDTILSQNAEISDYVSIVASMAFVHIVWGNEVNHLQDFYYKRSVNFGSGWEPSTRLTNFYSLKYSSTICVSGSGIHMIWEDNRDGNWEIYFKQNPYGNVGLSIISSVLPMKFALFQNYPNPFNPVTKIRFNIRERSFAQITVYDITGRFITFVLNENLAPGEYETEFDGAEMPSGVYFYRMTVDGVLVDSRKMILLK